MWFLCQRSVLFPSVNHCWLFMDTRSKTLMMKLHLVKHTFGAPMLHLSAHQFATLHLYGHFQLKKILPITARPYLSIALSFVSMSADTSSEIYLTLTSSNAKCVGSFSNKISKHIYIKEKMAINNTIMWKKYVKLLNK